MSEYIVTDSIEDQLESLLSKMQTAMEAGGANEVGVWVSGFYGSGKSSFTKYLGLAFDDSVVIDGQPFRKHLENRLHKPQTRALLDTLAKRYPDVELTCCSTPGAISGKTRQRKDHRTAALATPPSRSLKCQPRWARASTESAAHLSQKP